MTRGRFTLRIHRYGEVARLGRAGTKFHFNGLMAILRRLKNRCGNSEDDNELQA